VRSTSDIFVKAFGAQGFPEQRVRLEPAKDVEEKRPDNLSPTYEYWQLESTNKNNDAQALAASMKQFLADPENTVCDTKTNAKRLSRGGDLAILGSGSSNGEKS
jgi:predicted secreted hydrolase